MRILWITNQPTPQVAEHLDLKVGNGGGWMTEMSKQVSQDNILGMVFPIENEKKLQMGCADNIMYYAIPMKKNAETVNENVAKSIENAIKKFQPDIVHIWGTEYAHSLMTIIACKKLGIIDQTVVSIQGMVSVYARHFWGNINSLSIKIPTLIDIVYHCGLYRQYRNFVKRGNLERRALIEAKHVIGRTDWDYICTKIINENIKYHLCNESLRKTFYSFEWDIKKCERHSIFASQSTYPIKGTHTLIEALSIVKKFYPDVHLYITGRNRLKKGVKERLKDSGYDKYLRELIYKYGLENSITFLGNLNENEMCERYLKTNVYVLPSYIENSPNSLGEAMLLGVPVVTSDVGGVKELIQHDKEGYIYQSDAPYMLAGNIIKYFQDDVLATCMGKRARERALKNHDRKKNYEKLMCIYKEIADIDEQERI